jgi:hypothetical protein
MKKTMSKRKKAAESPLPELLFYTCANKRYEDFIPLYAFFALRTTADSIAEFGVEDKVSFLRENAESLDIVNRALGNGRITIRDVPWKDPEGKAILPNTVRFVSPPKKTARFVYIGDVDIIILETDLLRAHEAFMAKAGIPYSNSVRPNSTRMSGLHLTEHDAIYPLPDLSDLDLLRMNDEMVLYEIVRRRGLQIQDKSWFRPIHGIHISPNRRPRAEFDASGAVVKPGWGIEPYVQLWIEARGDPSFKTLRSTLSHRVQDCLEKIDQAVSETVRASMKIDLAARSEMTDPAQSPEDLGAMIIKKNKAVFTEIFETNKWGSTSKSGPGSTFSATRVVVEELRELITRLNVRTMADAPCGMFEWMSAVTPKLDAYLGFDIVEDLVSQLRAAYGDDRHSFMVADITQQTLPEVDAILCRDCLVHLPLSMGLDAIRRFVESGSRYLLSTTFPTAIHNRDSGVGGWRPLNLELAPYLLPPPVMLLRDRVPVAGDKYADKSLGVWDLDALR